MEEEMIKLHCFDNTHFLRSMVLCLTIRFDDVLDVDKLHQSMVHLLETDSWRKLGGRLLQVGYNRYSVRTVKRFTHRHPAVIVSEAHFNMSIKDHSLAPKMLHQSDKPSVHPGVEEFRRLCGDGNGPTSFKDYTSKGYSQILMHVVTFTDATFVSLTWPHTMTDGRGWADIFRAWSASMAEKSASIPRFMGYDLDTMDKFGYDEDVEQSLQEPERRNLAAVPGALARQAANALHEPKMKSRVFCLPADVLRHIDDKTTRNMTRYCFVHEIDVVKGWATNVVCSHMGTSSRRVCIHSFLDLRERLPARFPAVGAFVQNATFPYITQILAKDLVHGRFGDTAVAVYQSRDRMGEPEQLAATAKMLRSSGMRDRYQALGDPDGHHIYFIDWSHDGLLDSIDFSPAVETSTHDGAHEDDGFSISSAAPAATEGETRATKGKPSYFHTDIVSKSDLHGQSVFNLYGRDREGNYWFAAILHKKEMKNLEEEIQRLQSAGNS